MTQADKMDRLDVRQKNGRISKSDYTTGNPDSINVIRTVENYKKGWRKSFFWWALAISLLFIPGAYFSLKISFFPICIINECSRKTHSILIILENIQSCFYVMSFLSSVKNFYIEAEKGKQNHTENEAILRSMRMSELRNNCCRELSPFQLIFKPCQSWRKSST